ncbi:hypothetical protein I4Q68_001622 [Campylobacter lari]|uniref:hypothetical protein n=1 Tax=Campylobacter lari TaxID=201 RepID=UPI00127FC483|nr:hypothetical protein [Campylobacter lari]EAJ5701181.1 hypothetical protein [Campylobacter lari]EAK0950908.1 hypothetical protein [Campylobacter lari]EAK0951390.1 hypothetical protein [Campylobacter lari]EGQ5682502.1 hypothetical protein [Campylobacter lari]EGQ5683053.1 hypothetical protein [Campylobacter lari]
MREIIAVKKDFIAFNKKSFCQDRLLTSGKAYYLHYKDNNEFCGYAGKECVRQKCSNDLNTIPDFTKSLISNSKKDTNVSENRFGCTYNTNTNINDISMAIEYVVLRQDKLKEFEKANYCVLNDYYEEYLKTNTLSLNSIKHILNIEAKSPLKFKLDNLLTCYAYEYKILLALKDIPMDKRAYLISILSNLRQYYTLTDKQIEGLKEWFKRIENKEIREAKLKKFLYQNHPKTP